MPRSAGFRASWWQPEKVTRYQDLEAKMLAYTAIAIIGLAGTTTGRTEGTGYPAYVDVDEDLGRVVVTVGPFDVAKGTHYHHGGATTHAGFTWPEEGWIQGFRMEVVDASGRPLPSGMIHHGGVINLSRRQIASPAALRIFGMGQETAPVSLPSWMGLRMSAGEQLMAYVALVNPSDSPVEGVTLRIIVDWRPADAIVYSTPTSFTGRNASPTRRFRSWQASVKNVVPLVLYAQPNGRGEPEFDVAPGVTTVSSEVVLPMSGYLRAAGGHMHDHASEVRLEDAETGRTLVRLVADLDDAGHVQRVEEEFFPFRLRGMRLEAGHRYRVVGVYDNPTGALLPQAGMAYIAGAFIPDDLDQWPALDAEHPEYLSDLAGVVGEGSGPAHGVGTKPGH